MVAALGVGLLAAAPSNGATILAGALMGLGQCSAQCAMQAESLRGVDPLHIGRASNTYFIGMDAGVGFGPAASGAVLQAMGPAPMCFR